MFCNTKRQVTVPQEFHFATDERIPPQANFDDLFDKVQSYFSPYFSCCRLIAALSHHMLHVFSSFPCILNLKMTRLLPETLYQILFISTLRYITSFVFKLKI